jgi:tRNA dimethylallyltransferase
VKNGLKFINAPLFLVGATGTGKSAAAMELARTHAWLKEGAAILAMDAMQVYRGADIGTGKPTAAERAEVPHGGLDLVDFGANFDVARYLEHAAAFLREQGEAGRRVLIVGGTGLYFRALTRGLCEAPQGSDELRAELGTLSVEELCARLKAVDPAMLERVDGANPRRLARSIEVMEETGRSLLEWQAETPEPLVPEFTAFWIQREKAELSQRIEARVEAMFSQGWVEEVRRLAERYGIEVVGRFPGIGYREIAEAGPRKTEEATELRRQFSVRSREPSPCGIACGDSILPVPNGQNSKATGQACLAQDDEALKSGFRRTTAGDAAATESLKRDILVATRQYAKRQLTWFAREPNLQPVMLTGNQSLSAVLR